MNNKHVTFRTWAPALGPALPDIIIILSQSCSLLAFATLKINALLFLEYQCTMRRSTLCYQANTLFHRKYSWFKFKNISFHLQMDLLLTCSSIHCFFMGAWKYLIVFNSKTKLISVHVHVQDNSSWDDYQVLFIARSPKQKSINLLPIYTDHTNYATIEWQTRKSQNIWNAKCTI